MKFHLAQVEGNAFTGYGPGYVDINRVRYEQNLVAMPGAIVTGWAPHGFENLTREDFAQLLEMKPEIVLLGTGERIRFPHPRLSADLVAARIGLDVMDVKAACRTFNVLAAEGRVVAAALLLSQPPIERKHCPSATGR